MPYVAWPEVISYGPALLGEEWYRGLRLVAPPQSEPITLADAKAHLRVETSLDDVLIGAQLRAARGACEQYMSRALVQQTWKLILDRFPYAEQRLRLYRPPFLSLGQVRYIDIDQTWHTLDPTFTRIIQDNDVAWLVPSDITLWWPYPINPSSGSVEITFTAGYYDGLQTPAPTVENPNPTPVPTDGDPTNKVPAEIKAAILLVLGDLYTNREDTIVGTSAVTIPRSAEALMSPYRAGVNT